MELISTFQEVIQYLNDGEIVLLKNHTSFYKEKGHIAIHGPNAHYKLSFNDFQELYKNENFFLYKPETDEINTEKDNEYYAWKAKNAN